MDIKCIKINFDFDKKVVDIISEYKVFKFKEKILELRIIGCYKLLVIFNMKVLEVVVSCVGDDGIIFVIFKLLGKIFYVL